MPVAYSDKLPVPIPPANEAALQNSAIMDATDDSVLNTIASSDDADDSTMRWAFPANRKMTQNQLNDFVRD